MYDRLLKLIEAENDKWKKASRKPGARVPAHLIRGNRTAPGMMGGMRGVLNTSINRSQSGSTPSKGNPIAFDRLMFKLESANRSSKRVAAANEKYRKARQEQGSGQVEGKPNFVTTKEGEKARRAQKDINNLPFQAGRN